jgi:predicted component of viral defense system (DUF524 family)
MTLFIELTGHLYPLDEDLPSGSIREASKYTIYWQEQKQEADLDKYQLIISDISLIPCLAKGINDQVQIKWTWEPEFFSGQFYPELFYAGEKVWPKGRGEKAVTVDADARKLNHDEFCSMIEDIARISQILYSLSPAYKKSQLSRKGERLPLIQLEILNKYLNEILLAVELLSKNPKKKLESLRRDVPLHQVKQIDQQALYKLLVNPNNWVKGKNIPTSLKVLADKNNGTLFKTVSEVQKRLSFNTYENSFVKGLLNRLLYTVNNLEKQLSGAVSSFTQDPVKKRVAERKLERLKPYGRRIRQCLSLPFLAEVRAADRLEKVTVTMLKHPVYRRIHQFYLKFLLGLTPLGEEFLELSLERTYQLYEYWCFLKLAEYLLEHYGDEDVDADSLFTVSEENGGISLKLKHGFGSAIRINKNLKIYFQRQYNHYRLNGQEVGSYSFKMIPDIVIEKRDETGTTTLILDPKYRVGEQAIKEALGDMHKYKDALVDSSRRRIVNATYILIPNHPTTRDIAERYLPKEYKLTHGMGVCILSPGENDGLKEIDFLLQQFNCC